MKSVTLYQEYYLFVTKDICFILDRQSLASFEEWQTSLQFPKLNTHLINGIAWAKRMFLYDRRRKTCQISTKYLMKTLNYQFYDAFQLESYSLDQIQIFAWAAYILLEKLNLSQLVMYYLEVLNFAKYQCLINHLASARNLSILLQLGLNSVFYSLAVESILNLYVVLCYLYYKLGLQPLKCCD